MRTSSRLELSLCFVLLMQRSELNLENCDNAEVACVCMCVRPAVGFKSVLSNCLLFVCCYEPQTLVRPAEAQIRDVGKTVLLLQ